MLFDTVSLVASGLGPPNFWIFAVAQKRKWNEMEAGRTGGSWVFENDTMEYRLKILEVLRWKCNMRTFSPF